MQYDRRIIIFKIKFDRCQELCVCVCHNYCKTNNLSWRLNCCLFRSLSRWTSDISTKARCTSPCPGAPSYLVALRGISPWPSCPESPCPGASFCWTSPPRFLNVCPWRSAGCTWTQGHFCFYPEQSCIKYQPKNKTISNY